MKNNYFGVYDHKESDTFRPTIDKRVHKDYPVSKTLTTRDDSCAILLGNEKEGACNTMSLRIRKLTPCEVMKLMGFTRQDYQAMRDIGMSDAQIYHCAGDSIVCSVPAAILGNMCLEETELKQKIENYIEEVKNQ